MQFACLSSGVYFGIIASITVISFVISVYKHSLKSFFTTFWSFISVLLSDTFSLPINTLIDRQLTGVWLMSCTVLLAAFAGQLRTQLMKRKPIYSIDSLEHLYEWKGIKIFTGRETPFSNYLENNQDDPMAQELKTRLEFPDFKGSDRSEFSLLEFIDIDRVKNDDLVVALSYEYLQAFKRNIFGKEFEEDIDYHISDMGDKSEPFFGFTIRDRLSDDLVHKLDFT